MSNCSSCNQSHFLNRVAFVKSLDKIHNETTRNYFYAFFKFENLLFKLILLVVIGLIVMGSGFGIEKYILANKPDQIVLNPGVGLSLFDGANPSVVYLVQSIPIVISVIAFVFIPQWWLAFGFLFMGFGGLSNIIDRSLDFSYVQNGVTKSSLNAVVDYWPFVKTTINMNDVWVCIGIGVIVLCFIIWLVLTFKKYNQEEKQQALQASQVDENLANQMESSSNLVNQDSPTTTTSMVDSQPNESSISC